MTGPKQGEFWIVELRGRVSVAECIRNATHENGAGRAWLAIGESHIVEPRGEFRAVRKLDIGALLDETDRAKDRLIWLLIEAAGGKIEIGRPVLEKFNHQRATIEQHTEVGSGGTVFRSLLRASDND